MVKQFYVKSLNSIVSFDKMCVSQVLDLTVIIFPHFNPIMSFNFLNTVKISHI